MSTERAKSTESPTTAKPASRSKQQIIDDFIESYFYRRHQKAELSKVSKQFQVELRECADCLLSENPHGLVIIGDVGVGKTSMMSVLLRLIAENIFRDKLERFGINRVLCDRAKHICDDIQYGCVLVTHYDLVKSLRDDPDSLAGGGFPYDLSAYLLMIDDLGRAYDDKAGWNVRLQDEFFDTRWNLGLPTIITTNKSSLDLNEWPEWRRIVDRITDKSWNRILTFGNKEISKRQTR